MNVSCIDNCPEFNRVCGEADKEINGVYAGDLLSWVMSHANAGDVWVTIMSNVNVVAVASLTECACVILCEGVVPDGDVEAVCREKDITMFTTGLSVYDACVALSEMISQHE